MEQFNLGVLLLIVLMMESNQFFFMGLKEAGAGVFKFLNVIILHPF